MHAVEVIADDQAVADQPDQSAVDRHWGFHVGDVVQIMQGRSKKPVYALYCGQGRVIHAWTPSRQSYRVRVDSLRELQSSGYSATVTRVLDAFFFELLNLTPLEPKDSIQRAKTAMHSVTTSCVSNLSLILFARFGGRFFGLLRSLKEAYGSALGTWVFGALTSTGSPEVPESPLDMPSRLFKLDDKTGNNNEAASATFSEPAIKVFFGTNAEFLMSEWLGRSLADFVGDPGLKSQWYTIHLPAATNYLTPLCLMYDKEHAVFRLRCNTALGLPERMAADRMECGVCWMDFATLRVMVLKCNHYICDPCLGLLQRRECPYCRSPIRFAHEISDLVKRKALQIMMDGLALEDKAAVVPSNIDVTSQENDNDEPENDN